MSTSPHVINATKDTIDRVAGGLDNENALYTVLMLMLAVLAKL